MTPRTPPPGPICRRPGRGPRMCQTESCTFYIDMWGRMNSVLSEDRVRKCSRCGIELTSENAQFCESRCRKCKTEEVAVYRKNHPGCRDKENARRRIPWVTTTLRNVLREVKKEESRFKIEWRKKWAQAHWPGLGPWWATLPSNCLDCGTEFIASSPNQVRCVSHQKAYRVSNHGHGPRERCKFYNVLYQPVSWLWVYQRDGGVCQTCTKVCPLEKRGTAESDAPEVDHIWPLSVVGSPGHVPENLRLCCRDCNNKRGNKYQREQYERADD